MNISKDVLERMRQTPTDKALTAYRAWLGTQQPGVSGWPNTAHGRGYYRAMQDAANKLNELMAEYLEDSE
jgi:hypothetical protein